MSCHSDLEAADSAPDIGAGGGGIGPLATGELAGGAGFIPGGAGGVSGGRRGCAGGRQGLGLGGFVVVRGAGLVLHSIKFLPSFHEVCPDFQ